MQPSDIGSGLDLLKQIASDRFVFTATEYPSPIQRALRLDPASGEAQMWQPVNSASAVRMLSLLATMLASFIGVVPGMVTSQKSFRRQ